MGADAHVTTVFGPEAGSGQFVKSLPSIHMSVEDRRGYFTTYTNQKISEIRQFCQKRDFPVLECLIDLAIKFETENNGAYKLRRNGYAPSLVHVIEVVMPTIKSLEHGYLSDKKDVIEAAHGDVEIWLGMQVSHDFAEDNGIFQEDLIKILREKVAEKQASEVTRQQIEKIHSIADGMETLTHYRKFNIAQFEALTGARLSYREVEGDLGDLEEGKTASFQEHVPLLTEKMQRPPATNINPRVYACFKPGKAYPVIKVTAYGQSDQDAEDWVRYAWKWFDHAYIVLTKIPDRVTGVASRLGMKGFSLSEHDVYLDETRVLRDITGFLLMFRKQFPDSPLEPYLESQLYMLKLLCNMADFVVSHHPERNQEGGRNFEARTWRAWKEAAGTTPLLFSAFLPKAMLAYEDMDLIINPLYIFMFQLKDYAAAEKGEFNENHKTPIEETYDTLMEGLLEHGGSKCRDIAQALEYDCTKDPSYEVDEPLEPASERI